MKTIYGSFDDEQVERYKEKLHKDIHWLLIYKDPKLKEQYETIDYEKYFTYLMKKIDGLNELLFYPVEIINLMSILEASFIETKKESFDFMSFRKLIFDAQSIVNKINERR